MQMIKSIVALFILILWSQFSFSQNDNSQSPYFHVARDTDIESFPLQSTSAEVTINGPIANVKVYQTYKNNGNNPIEAMYVFPASTRAAVHYMQMTIGSRVINAEIKRKKEARQKYEDAKQNGQHASLLEQERPNVFQMHVANIMPGETIKIEMHYTEFLIPTDQQYTFVYPTVTGPRYTGTATPSSQDFADQTYISTKVKPTYSFDFKLKLDMSIPIIDVKCPSHNAFIDYFQNNITTVELHPDDTNRGNKDFIVQYRLAGEKVATGIQTYDFGGEKFFLCQMEAPDLDWNPEISPREYIFIVDVSGSMNGYPIEVSKELMKNLLGGMRPIDKFNVLFFASSAFALSDQSIKASRSNIKMAFDKMKSQRGGGGTQLLPAIKRAMNFPKADGCSRSFVIITDGYVTVEDEAFKLINQSLNEANFFSFGIGNSVNRHLIEGMAHMGRGEAFIVTEQKYALKEAQRLQKYITNPVLTDIEISSKNIEIYDIIPTTVPDLMASRPIYFFGKYKDDNNGKLTISAMKGNKKYNQTVAFTNSKSSNSLPYLWAREKIRFNEDFNINKVNLERVEEVTQLGLKYNLLTKYTSFIAIDDHPIIANGLHTKTVSQPLPLPHGMSDHAIGFEMELESITEPNNIATVKIETDVHSDDKLLEQIIENILKIEMKNYSKKDIQKYIGAKLDLIVDKNGKILSVKAISKDHYPLLNIINSHFFSLKMKHMIGNKITVSIKEV